MADLQIELNGLSQVLAFLDPVKAQQAVIRGIAKAAVLAKSEASKYPPDSNAHRPQAQNWGDKQRRGFFAALRAGDIEVPWQRGISPGSERFGQSWTTQARDGGLTQAIGNDTGYGKKLKDPQEQTAYHKETGWTTVEQDTQQIAPDAGRLVNDEIWWAFQ